MSQDEARTSPVLSVDQEGIASLVFDDPDRSVNLLTEGVMGRLAGLIDELHTLIEGREVRGVIIRSGKPGQFIAGADVSAIASIEDPETGEAAARFGQAVLIELERITVPTVAAIDGLCLGGGLEMALACRYRLASDSDSTRLGLPEVQLGILPAWGGTTRLPRLIGLRSALDLLLSGKKIDGGRALRYGLVNALLPADAFPTLTRDWILERLRSGPIPSGARRGLMARLLEDTLPGRRFVFASARKRVMKQTGGHYPAPLRILEVVSSSLGRALPRALEVEAEAAGELISSAVSKQLIHVFHLRERARRPRTSGDELTSATSVHPVPSPSSLSERPATTVKSIAVIGAGVMGGGIAQLAAAKQVRVRLKDIRHEAVANGLAHARSVFERLVSRGRLTPADRNQAMARISGSLDYSGFGTVDLVVEAVVERLDVKRQVLAEAETHVGKDCVIATNTSSLRVDAIAEELSRPEQFAGLHFFNPVDRMPLVEIVRGAQSSESTLNTLHQFALDVGKVPVVVGDGDGFVVNRILGPYLNEAGHLLTDGFSGPAIDSAAVDFGMPMGPLRLIDEIGLDIARHAGDSLHQAFGDRLQPSAVLGTLVEAGRLGRKGSLGFYRYKDGQPDGFDDDTYALLSETVPAERTAPDSTLITRRLILAMMNEAARVLEDGIAESAADVDLAMIMGTGFPPFRGGLLRYADTVHLKTVKSGLDELAATSGGRFTAASLIGDLAAADEGFYDRFPHPV